MMKNKHWTIWNELPEEARWDLEELMKADGEIGNGYRAHHVLLERGLAVFIRGVSRLTSIGVDVYEEAHIIPYTPDETA